MMNFCGLMVIIVNKFYPISTASEELMNIIFDLLYQRSCENGVRIIALFAV